MLPSFTVFQTMITVSRLTTTHNIQVAKEGCSKTARSSLSRNPRQIARDTQRTRGGSYMNNTENIEKVTKFIKSEGKETPSPAHK